MPVINVLLTDPIVNEFEPFIHRDTEFRFAHFSPRSLFKPVDGPVWAFIDWMLEDIAGLELCRRMRADSVTASAHITIVLEDDDIEARKRALQAGADDYMLGPINRRIILDRIFALKPISATGYSPDQVDYGPLTIDFSAYRAYWRGSLIDVSLNEFRLLKFFAQNANRTLSRQEIVQGLGRNEEQIDERTVDVWVGRLRKAISQAGGGNPIRTVRMIGYVFDL